MGNQNFVRVFLSIGAFALLIATYSTTTFAEDRNNGEASKSTPNKNPRNLPAVFDPQVVYDLLDTASNVDANIDSRVESIRNVSKLSYDYVAKILVDLFLEEIHRDETPDGQRIARQNKNPLNYPVIYNLIVGLGDVLTQNELEYFHEAMAKLSAKTRLFNEGQQHKIGLAITEARKKINSRDKKLPKLPPFAAKPSLSHSGRQPTYASSESYLKGDAELTLQQKSKQFQILLEKYIKGQPHVVERLVRLRSRDAFFGLRETPAFLWFMGPPGTGKDTSVRGYLAAVHKDPNAHKNHLYRIDPLRKEADLNTLLGSSTGYRGSEHFPPILQFLVEHSAGKYMIEENLKASGSDPKFKIIENPNWQPGMVLPGYFAPEDGIVYCDEFHDWSKENKNAVAKKAVEYEGVWTIKSPNGGLKEIYVPINIVAASNDGIELVTSREKNGERFGKPLTYEQMKSKADVVRNNPTALRGSILKGNDDVAKEDQKGTSEELLNRIPEDNLILFDPISPEFLRHIAENKMGDLQARVQRSTTGFDKVNLKWTENVIRFLQEYHYVAEDQARPIDNKITALIENTIIEASKKDLLLPNETVEVLMDVVLQPNNTWKMLFKVKNLENSTTPERFFDLPVSATLVDSARLPITDAELDKLMQLPANLKRDIVGQRHVLDKLGRALILTAEGRASIITAADAKDPARAFMLLGPTSTGKTETAKVIAENEFGDRNAAVTIDCTQLQTIEAMTHKILGFKDASGKPVISDFMKHYDRNNGRLVIVLDELANVRDKDVLNALFDLLREPVLATFSDNRERILSNVIILITGNASQEILKQLPSHLPEDVLREAWMEIYERLEIDPEMRRHVLENYFNPPLIARMGDERIFFYKPLSYAQVRELTIMKLENMIDNLEPKEGRRGWSVRVANVAEYMQILTALEDNGFRVKEQGASIDTYVREVFGKELRAQLLLNKFADKDTVDLSFVETKIKEVNHEERRVLVFNLTSKTGKTIQFEIDGKPIEHAPVTMKEDTLLVSAHEAGHMIAGMALMGDFTLPSYLRILPGVTNIADEWIYYAGIAGHQEIRKAEKSRDYFINEIAILMAGTVAESLVVDGGINTAGRSNDIQRATILAKRALLDFGMSEKLGYLQLKESDLSDEDRKTLHTEMKAMVDEGANLAKKAILANKELFVRYVNDLGRAGKLNKKQIIDTMNQVGLVKDYDPNFQTEITKNEKDFNTKTQTERRAGLKYKFVATLGLMDIKDVVDIAQEIKDRKAKDLTTATIPQNLAINGRPARKTKGTCALLLSNTEEQK